MGTLSPVEHLVLKEAIAARFLSIIIQTLFGDQPYLRSRSTSTRETVSICSIFSVTPPNNLKKSNNSNVEKDVLNQ